MTIKEIFAAERGFRRYDSDESESMLDRLETAVQEVIDERDKRIASLLRDYDLESNECRERGSAISVLKQKLSAAEDEMDALRNRVQCAIESAKEELLCSDFNDALDRIKDALWGAEPQVCEWVEYDSEYPGTYKTVCGHMFSFTEDGIKENGAKHCMYCGKAIKEVKK